MKPITAIVIISLLAAFIVGLLFVPVGQSFMGMILRRSAFDAGRDREVIDQ